MGASILIVDDEEGLRHGLENLFHKEGFTVHSAASFESAVAVASQYALDAAVVDLRLKEGRSGLDLLLEMKRLEPDLVVIVITGYGSIDTAVTSLKGGAADYFLKPIDNKKLLDAVRKNLELRALKTENRFLREELVGRFLPYRLVTGDPALLALVEKADLVKDNPVTVLITGESGTGKEVLARYLHFTGARKEGKFIDINCAALSESLLLSELFGHERGAFTGAVERKRGRFELADGGTLLLDEIGDMSLEVQAKLLRVIEESGFERLGGVKRIEVDARIIAATNKDLPALIREGRFREDLFYRINVVSFHLPPLRERRADIPLLIEHFLDKYCGRYGRRPVRLAPETLSALMEHDWPGNVRELENVINQIVLLGEKSFLAGRQVPITTAFPAADALVDPAAVTSLKDAVGTVTEHYEKRIITECLRRNRGNKSKTARDLSITRRTLAQKLEKYRLSSS
jgi:DNA-binding NtrC family response regulator